MNPLSDVCTSVRSSTVTPAAAKLLRSRRTTLPKGVLASRSYGIRYLRAERVSRSTAAVRASEVRWSMSPEPVVREAAPRKAAQVAIAGDFRQVEHFHAGRVEGVERHAGKLAVVWPVRNLGTTQRHVEMHGDVWERGTLHGRRAR